MCPCGGGAVEEAEAQKAHAANALAEGAAEVHTAYREQEAQPPSPGIDVALVAAKNGVLVEVAEEDARAMEETSVAIEVVVKTVEEEVAALEAELKAEELASAATGELGEVPAQVSLELDSSGWGRHTCRDATTSVGSQQRLKYRSGADHRLRPAT